MYIFYFNYDNRQDVLAWLYANIADSNYVQIGHRIYFQFEQDCIEAKLRFE